MLETTLKTIKIDANSIEELKQKLDEISDSKYDKVYIHTFILLVTHSEFLPPEF